MMKLKHKTIPVTFDDTWYFIEVGDEEYKCLHSYEYSECLHILLNSIDVTKYTSATAAREFKTTEKKVEKFKNYLLTNYWRVRGLT